MFIQVVFFVDDDLPSTPSSTLSSTHLIGHWVILALNTVLLLVISVFECKIVDGGGLWRIELSLLDFNLKFGI